MAEDDDKLVHVGSVEIVVPGAPETQGERLESPNVVEVGQWYWIKDDKKEEWFACVTSMGTNYVEVTAPNGGYARIHFDEFWDEARYEPDPDGVINGKMGECQREVNRLLGRVQEVTASLSIGNSPMLDTTSETKALALRGDRDMGEYSKALVTAKKETLPALFDKISKTNKEMAVWMTAKILPLKAKAGGLNQIVDAINDRVFSVELYAGLTEHVERVRDGEPAPIGTKVHLMQRRCYMDEECLAQYKTGGMEFKDIRDFDAWLSQPENLDRLLPFPRCVVSFQVRRKDKEREVVNLSEFIRMLHKLDADRSTFLYIRNGDLLYRMNTSIEFGPKLFPDMDRNRLGSSKLWAQMSGSHVNKLITDDEHTGILEDHDREEAEYKARKAAYDAALATPEAKEKAKAKGLRHGPDASCVDVPWPGLGASVWDLHGWVAYDKSSVYYDDITQHIQKLIKEHNRIALILQGLLDRSPVLHPHPPWQIWTSEGFQAALELVFDESRTLVAGAKPDFEAYRARLNASLKVGCITVGQELAWEEHEAEKECDRRDRDWRDRGRDRPKRWRPEGNPGPGTVDQVAEYSPRAGRCTYAWQRDRLRRTYRGEDDPLRTTFTCTRDRVLNVSAYKPGDFRQFFADPRTREEYLQWAPLLLEAEEYHAGNRPVIEPPAPEPKRMSTWEGRRRYEQRKVRERILGKAVRLHQDIMLKNGKVHEKGTLWRVSGYERIGATIHGIDALGKHQTGEAYRAIRGVSVDDLVLDDTIPDEESK